MVKARTDNYIPVNVCLPPELMDRTSFSVTLTGIERGEVSAEVSQVEPNS
jgi:hypothetical protein